MGPQQRFGEQSIEELARENEARVDLDLDGAYVGLFEWNIITGQSSWSRGFYRLHGLETNQGSSYELWLQQVHPDDRRRVEAEVQRAISIGETVDTDYRIVRPDGKLRWTYLKAVVRKNAAGVPEVLSGYCGDITRRKLADAALLESQKLAIAGRMSAAIAHEISNPLAAAYNLLHLASGLASDQSQIDLLDRTVEQLRRISEISKQTLQFVRPSPPRHVRIPEIVQSTLLLLGPKLRLSALTVETDFRQTEELLCSPNELQQILTNILNNAAEASSTPRRAKIRVRNGIDWKNRSLRGVRITVADAGPGMKAETLRRLREPFFTTKEQAGTGLGMWVVDELVVKRAGSMAIRSGMHPRHHGTLISIFFPLDSGASS